MRKIVIAYPAKDTALKLRALLEGEGFHVSYVCATGSSVLSISQDMNEGVVICAENLRDMSAGNIAEHLPTGFDIIAITRGDTDSFMSNLIYMPTPLDRDEFLSTVSVLANSASAFTQRSGDDGEIISKAKLVLMEKNSFTETQAHRYMQKESMRQGKKIVSLAKEILNDFV